MERECVLLVDDDPAVTESYRRSLRREPYELLTASSGIEALGMLKRARVHAVVTDEKMPEVSGTELLKVLRSKYPDVMRIMLTGQASVQVACNAINIGEVHRFLLKPCSGVELAVAIRDALKLRKVQAQPGGMVELLKMQAAYIRHLESEHPGISHVETDENGTIICDMDEDEISDILSNLEGMDDEL
jgi:DNA-binding NtrC family response regulator